MSTRRLARRLRPGHRILSFNSSGAGRTKHLGTRYQVARKSTRDWALKLVSAFRPDVIVRQYHFPIPQFDLVETLNIPSVQSVLLYGAGFAQMSDDEVRRFIKRSAIFVCPGKKVRDYLHGCWGVPLHRIATNCIGLDLTIRDEQMRYPGRLRRADIGLEEDSVVVATSGSFHYLKGVDIWVETAALLRDRYPAGKLKFMWIGGSEGQRRHSLYGSAVMSLVSEYGLTDDVIFAGDQRYVYPYLDACDIYVQPSRDDAFPHATLEAMAVSKPVVAFPEGVAREPYAQHALVRVDEYSPEALADGVAKLIECARSAAKAGAGWVASRPYPLQHCCKCAPSRRDSYQSIGLSEMPHRRKGGAYPLVRQLSGSCQSVVEMLRRTRSASGKSAPSADLQLWPGVFSGNVLNDLDAPSRASWNRKHSVGDLRLEAKEFVAPWHVVEVVFEEKQIGHDRGEMRAYGRAKMAVEIMGRNGETKQLGGICGFLRLEKSVPENIDAYDICAVTAQQVEICRGTHEILAGSNWRVGNAPQIAKGADRLGVDFKPRESRTVQLARELREGRRAKVVVQIHRHTRFPVEPLAKGIYPRAKIS